MLGPIDPAPLLLLAVATAGFVGGVGGGLLTAALAVVYAAFTYSPDHARQFLLLLLVAPAIALLTGLLRRRVDQHERGPNGGESVAALRQSEERLRLALVAGRTGTWDWNILTNRVAWSSQLSRFHGLQHFTGTSDDFLRMVHPDDRPRVEEATRRALEQGDYNVEFRTLREDGQVRWLSTTGRVMYDPDHRPVRMLGATTDITERRAMEDELRRSKESLEEANRAKDQFIAVLSHELRNPLAPVLMAARMLEQDEKLLPEQRRLVLMIRRNAELEARIIDDLLDVTRIARGKLQLSLSDVDLHEVVQHALEAARPQIQEKHLTVETHLEAPRSLVRADAARLQQVFWNLLTNAAKFTPAGGKIVLRSSCPEPGTLEVEVRDTGVGIEPELLPHIFNAFEQGGAGTTRQFGGLGLGLAIVKALVQMHHGTIRAHSEGRGCGTRFTIDLPLLAAPAAPPPHEAPQRHAQQQRLRLLVVEDQEDSRRLLVDFLRSLGHEVQEAGSVDEALAAAQRDPPDLAISDLGLPDGSGTDLMRQLRQRHALRGIAISGYGMEADLERSRDAGFDLHLTKPVDLQRLAAVLGEYQPQAPELAGPAGSSNAR